MLLKNPLKKDKKQTASPNENENTTPKATETTDKKLDQKETESPSADVEAEKQISYTAYSIEELISAYKDLSTSDDWLKNHKTLQNLNQLFEDKFKTEVELQKKKILKRRRKRN